MELRIVNIEKKADVLNELASKESLFKVVAQHLKEHEFPNYNWGKVDMWLTAKDCLVDLYSEENPHIVATEYFHRIAKMVLMVIPDFKDKQNGKDLFDKWFSGVLLAMYTITYTKESIEETNRIYSIAKQIRDIIKTLHKDIYRVEQLIDDAIEEEIITQDWDYTQNVPFGLVLPDEKICIDENDTESSSILSPSLRLDLIKNILRCAKQCDKQTISVEKNTNEGALKDIAYLFLRGAYKKGALSKAWNTATLYATESEIKELERLCKPFPFHYVRQEEGRKRDEKPTWRIIAIDKIVNES